MAKEVKLPPPSRAAEAAAKLLGRPWAVVIVGDPENGMWEVHCHGRSAPFRYMARAVGDIAIEQLAKSDPPEDFEEVLTLLGAGPDGSEVGHG